MFPKDIRYTITHEWIRLEDDVATIGMTQYATDRLSDISYVELSSSGDELSAEMVLGTLESTTDTVDLLSPIDGEVVEVNDSVVDNPELIAADPYDDGWLIRLKPSDASQLKDLMTAEEYQVFVQAEVGEEAEEEEKEEEKAEGKIQDVG